MANKTKAELINEIEHLRTENHERSERLREKSKQIKQLQADNEAQDGIVKGSLDRLNEIRELRGYRAKAKVVKARLRNEIKDLQQELATSRDYSDKQADVIRHYVNNNAELDKAATNLQHFRRFSND